jgi:alkylated DNA nucleotide flippase Atl1
MTHRRKQVLEALTAEAEQGQRIPWARVARRCGLYSFRDAQRIARDLKNLGAI